MAARVASAAIGIPLFIGLCLWGAVPFAIGVLVVACVGLGELTLAYRRNGILANPFLAACGILSVVWPVVTNFPNASPDAKPPLFYVGDGTMTLALLALVVLAPLWELTRCAMTGEMSAARNLGFGAVCGGYTALYSGMIWVRMTSHESPSIFYSIESTWWQPMLVTVLCVWATDSFAYFVGRAIGKNKLVPKLSPGKTIEGAIGGLVAGIVTGAGMGHWLLGSWKVGVAIGLIAGVLGQIGDLFESALKRELGIKDFGEVMPGHGGALDRFDSLLFVAPVVALLLQWKLPIDW